MTRRATYDEFGRTRPLDVVAYCRSCGGPIKYDQPCDFVHRRAGGPPIGMVHQYCPPALVASNANQENA